MFQKAFKCVAKVPTVKIFLKEYLPQYIRKIVFIKSACINKNEASHKLKKSINQQILLSGIIKIYEITFFE